MLSAILGGAIGVVLSALARALGIPTDVRTHDAAVADRDDALATWTADRDYVLRRECMALREKTTVSPNESLRERPDAAPPFEAVSPMRQAGIDYVAEVRDRAVAADRAIADAKGQALHEYRDEARRAQLAVAQILASEGWAHRIYRRATNHAAPGLITPDRAVPVLDAWRKPSAMNAERYTWPDDATKRTLEDAIETMPITGP